MGIGDLKEETAVPPTIAQQVLVFLRVLRVLPRDYFTIAHDCLS
jgi:hypothetical protein